MPEDMGGRLAWIKLYVQEYLYGTTRDELDPDERSVWADFLCLAGDSVIPGVICISPDNAYTEYQLAKTLNIPEELLQRSVDKFVRFGKVTLDGSGCFEIVNWSRYQDAMERREYMRNYMRDYRDKKRKARETPNAGKLNSKPLHTDLTGKELTGVNVEDETREEKEKRREEKNGIDDAPSALEIHELYFGSVGIPNEALRETFMGLQQFPIEEVEEVYKYARGQPAGTIQYPAGYVLFILAERHKADKPPQATEEESEAVRRRREVAMEQAKDDKSDYHALWQPVVDHLKSQVTKTAYESYVQDTSLVAVEGDLFVVAVPSLTAKKHLDQRLKALFCKAVREIIIVDQPEIDFYVPDDVDA